MYDKVLCPDVRSLFIYLLMVVYVCAVYERASEKGR